MQVSLRTRRCTSSLPSPGVLTRRRAWSFALTEARLFQQLMRPYAFSRVHVADDEPRVDYDVITYHGPGDKIQLSGTHDTVMLHAGNPVSLALLHLRNFFWDCDALAGS